MTAPLGFGDQESPVPGHIGFLHRGGRELREGVQRFMSPSLDKPTEALYFFGVRGVPAALLRDVEADIGRDLSAEVRAGRIVFGEPSVDADAHLERILDPLARLAARFSLTRLVGVVAWDSPAFPFPEDFLWFESKLNDAISAFPVIVLCAYDMLRIPARALVYAGIETHPYLLTGGVLNANDEYVPPDRYLATRLLTLPWPSEP
jgi:hypothetical protein